MPLKEVYTLHDLRNWSAAAADVSPPPRLAVFGDPVAHSLSPQMHNPALAEAGIDARYVRIHVSPAEFPEALRLLPELGFFGTNCTIPHKFAALAEVDEVDGLARRLGAVNTVVCEPGTGRLLGYNSDGPGFLRAVREEFGTPVADMRVLVLGAGGGAGKAAATQCAIEGCRRLVLVNRTPEKAEAVAADLRPLLGACLEVCAWEGPALARALPEIDLIVNGTSVGMRPDDPELIPEALLRPEHFAFDMIYSPPETAFLRSARRRGGRGVNGLSMLLWQGVHSFEWWFRRPAPVEAMRRGLAAAVESRNGET